MTTYQFADVLSRFDKTGKDVALDRMMANAGLNTKKMTTRSLTHSTTSRELQAGSFNKLNMLKQSLIQQEQNNLSNALERIRMKSRSHVQILADQTERKTRARPQPIHAVQRLKRCGAGGRTLPSLQEGVVEGIQINDERKTKTFPSQSNDVRKRGATTAPGRVNLRTSPRERLNSITRTNLETQGIENSQTGLRSFKLERRFSGPPALEALYNKDNQLITSQSVVNREYKTQKLFTGLPSRKLDNKEDAPVPELSPVTYRLGKRICDSDQKRRLVSPTDPMPSNVPINYRGSVVPNPKIEKTKKDDYGTQNKHSEERIDPFRDGIRAHVMSSLLSNDLVRKNSNVRDLSRSYPYYTSPKVAPKSKPMAVKSILVEMPSIVFQPSSPESDLTDDGDVPPRAGKSLQRIFRQNELCEKEVKDLLEDVRELNEKTIRLQEKAQVDELQASMQPLQLTDK